MLFYYNNYHIKCTANETEQISSPLSSIQTFPSINFAKFVPYDIISTYYNVDLYFLIINHLFTIL